MLIVCVLFCPPLCMFCPQPFNMAPCPTGVATRDWTEGDCPQSVLANPPLTTAVEWNVRNRDERSGDVAVQNAIERSTVAQDQLIDQMRSGNVNVPTDDEPVLRTYFLPTLRYILLFSACLSCCSL